MTDCNDQINIILYKIIINPITIHHLNNFEFYCGFRLIRTKMMVNDVKRKLLLFFLILISLFCFLGRTLTTLNYWMPSKVSSHFAQTFNKPRQGCTHKNTCLTIFFFYKTQIDFRTHLWSYILQLFLPWKLD